MSPTQDPHAERDPGASLRERIASTLGLCVGDDRVALLREVVAERVRATGATDVDDWFARLAASRNEQGEVARRLVVPETCFMRNGAHFDAIAAAVRELERRGRRHLRLLSAGCSTGEEPYSLAMLMREVLERPETWTLDIIGVDLNPDALAAARSARYSRWSLRQLPDALRTRYFEPCAGRRHALRPEVRDAVRFVQRNLLSEDLELWQPASWDVVLCRNVLMYLTPQAASGIVARIARALVPGGLLFLGHAETLRGLSHDFDLVHDHDTFYYARRIDLGAAPPATAAPAQEGDAPAWTEAIARAGQRIEQLARAHRDASPATPVPPVALDPARELLGRERFDEALAWLETLPERAASQPDALLLRAVVQVNRGAVAAAERACRLLLEHDARHAGAHYLLALCREQAGDVAAAIEHDETSMRLDPEFAMPHLHLGLMARRRGERGRARRELERAVCLLEHESTARLALFGGGFGRRGLVHLCRAELDAAKPRGT